MRLLALAVTVVLAAACDEPRTVILVDSPLYTDADRRVTSVALVVGYGAPHAATVSIVEPASRTRDDLDGIDAWFIDAALRETRFPIDDDGAVQLVLAPGDAELGPIAAFGLDANQQVIATATLFGATIATSGIEQHHMQLALGISSNSARYVNGCAYVPGTALLVDEHDEDCDRYPTGDALECVPDVGLATEGPKLQDTSCLAPLPPGTVPGASCTLAGPGCTDGMGDTTCTAGAYCTAPSLCDVCAAEADPLDCAANLVAQHPVGAPFHLACTFRVQGGEPCAQGLAVLDGGVTPDFTCTDVLVRGATATQPDWQNTLEDPLSGLRFELRVSSGPGMPCGLSVQMSGPPPATPAFSVGGIMAVKLGNHAGLGIPVEMNVVPGGCDSGSSDTRCAIVTDHLVADKTALTACALAQRPGTSVDD